MIQQSQKIKPLCPVFKKCGGCFYQDVSYDQELHLKEENLKTVLKDIKEITEDLYDSVVASPKPYHYRSRLDLKLQRTKKNGILVGFTPHSRRGIVPIDYCYIAEESIADFIKDLKLQAIDRLPQKYRLANLVVKTDDSKRVVWGGIGRRSTRLDQEDYLWIEINGKKVFYSLDTFFQANLSILPLLINYIRSLDIWEHSSTLYDLYGGVGLFGVSLYDLVDDVVLIEESKNSIKLAQFNSQYNKCKNFSIIEGKVEDKLQNMIRENELHKIAIIDPPRSGLSESVVNFLSSKKLFSHILYLSCNPEALARDLDVFVNAGWKINKIKPFDFFPKTKHLETLVLLRCNK